MSDIRPFKGLRPTPAAVSEIAAPPYDVVDTEEARALAEGNPLSFLRVSRAEIEFPPTQDPYAPEVYARARENLDGLRAAGHMVQDQQPRLYVYRQIMGSHSQTGLLACCSCLEYDKGLIKKHELTRKDKEDDRTRHTDRLDANPGPVFLTYRARKEIDQLVTGLTKGSPEYDFTASDGVRHTLWVVADQKTQDRLVAEFKKIPCTYVADGHHRAASGWRVWRQRKEQNKDHTGREEYNWFMAVVFPHDQLRILDYNRVVKDLHGLSAKDFLAKVGEKFQVAAAKEGKPTKSHEVGMYLDRKWYRLTAKPGTFSEKDVIGKLDVSILQRNLLAPLLGIEDPRTDKRIHFVGGIRGLGELQRMVDEKGFAVAFAMYPTSLDELMAIADAGQIMPPKSTWFEPKLRSGLVVHLLSDPAPRDAGDQGGGGRWDPAR